MWVSRYVCSHVFLSDLIGIINIVMNLGAKRCAGWVFAAKLAQAKRSNLTLDNRQRHILRWTGRSRLFYCILTSYHYTRGKSRNVICMFMLKHWDSLQYLNSFQMHLQCIWLHWHCYFIYFNIRLQPNQNFPTVL